MKEALIPYIPQSQKVETETRPYWMIATGPRNCASHLFWLAENITDFFRQHDPNTTTLTEDEEATLRSAIQLFRTAQVRNQKEVRTNRELIERGEPSLIEGIEAYKQVKRVLQGVDDKIVDETLSVGLQVLEVVNSNTPLKDIPPDKLQKVEEFFVSASDYAFENMAARYRPTSAPTFARRGM